MIYEEKKENEIAEKSKTDYTVFYVFLSAYTFSNYYLSTVNNNYISF